MNIPVPYRGLTPIADNSNRPRLSISHVIPLLIRDLLCGAVKPFGIQFMMVSTDSIRSSIIELMCPENVEGTELLAAHSIQLIQTYIQINFYYKRSSHIFRNLCIVQGLRKESTVASYYLNSNFLLEVIVGKDSRQYPTLFIDYNMLEMSTFSQYKA